MDAVIENDMEKHELRAPRSCWDSPPGVRYARLTSTEREPGGAPLVFRSPAASIW